LAPSQNGWFTGVISGSGFLTVLSSGIATPKYHNRRDAEDAEKKF
jgi:hypothetical protein